MRVILIGGGSFIAHAVAAVCRETGIEMLSLCHAEDPKPHIGISDCVINFAIDPRYRSGPYEASQDCDLRAARATAASGAHFVMLSSRRVYGPNERWGAVETAAAQGDETHYGRNKAVSEVAIRDICGSQITLLRLSNIFGYEYTPAAPRYSFVGMMLGALRQQNKIIFDMSPSTQRDFLPIEICARLLVARAVARDTGTYNLGSGFSLACGDVAGWIMQGFGSGALIVEDERPRDTFFLDMSKWRARFELPVDAGIVQNYCIELGERLKCEKF